MAGLTTQQQQEVCANTLIAVAHTALESCLREFCRVYVSTEDKFQLLRSAQANPAALQALLMQAAKNGQSPAQALAALFANHASSSSQVASVAHQLKEQRAKEEQLLKEQAAAATQANTAAQQVWLVTEKVVDGW